MTTLIKICGITRPQDAEAAIEAGADWLGLIFSPASARRVSVENVKTWLEPLRNRVRWVALFQDQALAEMEAVCQALHPDFIQLHGSETPETCEEIALRTGCDIIKAFSDLPARFADAPWKDYARRMTFALLDRPKSLSGDAQWLPQALETLRAADNLPPYLLAGGLTPETVESAVSTLCPLGVDVASGVESAPGIKDPDRMVAFCQAVRRAENPTSNRSVL